MSDRYLIRSREIAARMLGGEMMIMSVVDSTLFTLNETATIIWNAADGRTSLRQIIETLIVPGFEVDFETAYQDALILAEELEQHGILRVAERPFMEDGL